MTQVNGVWVELWPDNDGGLWYYDPYTGEAKTLEED